MVRRQRRPPAPILVNRSPYVLRLSATDITVECNVVVTAGKRWVEDIEFFRPSLQVGVDKTAITLEQAARIWAKTPIARFTARKLRQEIERLTGCSIRGKIAYGSSAQADASAGDSGDADVAES